jgi:hypothetical protein
MRYPGMLYTKGDYCWQNGGKYYRLLLYHIRVLADYFQASRPLNRHNDVLEKFRRLIPDNNYERKDKERKESEQSR